MDQNVPPVVQTPENVAQASSMIPPSKKMRNGIIVVAVVVIVIVLIVAAIRLTAPDPSPNVKSSASEMTLKQSDLPSGWHASEIQINESSIYGTEIDWADASFDNSVTGAVDEPKAGIGSQIYLYNSVDEAKADYIRMLNGVGYTFDVVDGPFDQCRLWSWAITDFDPTSLKWYAFQEKNVCIFVTFWTIHGYELTQDFIDDILDAQERRIV